MTCTAPFAAQGVMQFRPDFAAGLFTAIGIVLLLRGNFADSTRTHRLAAGLAFGFALLAKRTGSPFTLGIVLGSLVLAGICDRVERRDLTLGRVAASWGVVSWPDGPVGGAALCVDLAVRRESPRAQHVTGLDDVGGASRFPGSTT
jgi:4-amino-4-deoxy-L-arabinose transferase-like glycosyltransferase